MLEAFENNLKERKLLSHGACVVLGVSGGPDSMCMLDLFLAIRKSWNLTLHVVHMDHQFRMESKDEAKVVREFCENNKVEFHMYSKDVEQIAKANKMSFEEAGRKVRYEAFFEVKDIVGAECIAVAQNKNDQAETILMRIMRGTGIDGLTGVPEQREDGVIRPVLRFDRKSIEAYCNMRKLPVCHDATNDTTDYTRNRIRNELLPYIQSHFNPQVIDALERMGETLKSDSEYIQEQLELTIESQGFSVHEGGNFSIEWFSKLHGALKTRFIRMILSCCGTGLKNVSRVHIDEIVILLDRKAHGKRKQISGVEFIIEYEKCYAGPVKKNSGAVVADENRLMIQVVEKDAFSKELLKVEDTQVAIALDYDQLQGELIVRPRSAGDRFTPLGMTGSKKVKDFFIDLKIPARKRDEIPIVCDRKGIVWIVGLRLDHRVRITEKTKRICVLKWLNGCSKFSNMLE